MKVLLVIVGLFLFSMKLNELWIGDELEIISKAMVGKFDGIAGQNAIVLINDGRKMLVHPRDLKPYKSAVEEVDEISFEPIEKKSLSHHLAPTKIDLHINILDPSRSNDLPARILQLQLAASSSFLNMAENNGLSYVTIIHGKGKGVLKAEVIHLLKQRPSVKHFIEVSDGGALEVMFY